MIEWKEGVSLGDWPIMSAKFGDKSIVIDNDEEGIYRYNYYVSDRSGRPQRLAKGIVAARDWDEACSKVVHRIMLALQEAELEAREKKTDFRLWVDGKD